MPEVPGADAGGEVDDEENGDGADSPVIPANLRRDNSPALYSYLSDIWATADERKKKF